MSTPARPPQFDNLIWILIDGLRPDYLASCSGQTGSGLYIDQLLSSGLLFSRMFTGNGCSKTSLHAAFTSMYGVSNGVRGYTLENIDSLDPWVLTLPDHLKHAGFKTFRYCDKNDAECYATPKSGFDVWEDSGFHRLAKTPGSTFELPARDRFIDRFNAHRGSKFAFLHLLSLHDVCGDKETYHWKSETYRNAIAAQSEELRRLISRFERNERTLLVLSTDHGIMLDAHRLQTTRSRGVLLEDAHMRVFAAFIGSGIAPREVSRLTRTIDIAPTLLEAVGAPPMGAQGVSLWKATSGQPVPDLDILMTRDSAYEDPAWSDSPCTFGIRTNRWKYVTHRWRQENTWLMDLERHGDFQVNLAGQGLPIEKELRDRVFRELIVAPPRPVEIYHSHNARFSREDLRPEIRVLLPLRDKSPDAVKVVRSLLHQVGPYQELVVLDGTGDAATFIAVQKAFWPHPHLVHRRVNPDRLGIEVLDSITRAAAPYIAVVDPGIVHPPNLIHRLHEGLTGSGESSVSQISAPPTESVRGTEKPAGWMLRRIPVTVDPAAADTPLAAGAANGFRAHSSFQLQQSPK